MSKEIELRKKFITDYTEIDKLLDSVGFKSKMSNTAADYHFSHYDKYCVAMYGVEYFEHEILKISIRFLRDRNEHKFMIVGLMGTSSDTYTMLEFKNIILDYVRKERDSQLAKLHTLLHI